MPIRPGHHRLVQQLTGASAQRADFWRSPGQRLGKRAGQEYRAGFRHRLQNLVVNRLAGPNPQHGAQLVLDVQTQSMVDPVDLAVDAAQDAPPLRSALLVSTSNTATMQPDVACAEQNDLRHRRSRRPAALADSPAAAVVGGKQSTSRAPGRGSESAIASPG